MKLCVRDDENYTPDGVIDKTENTSVNLEIENNSKQKHDPTYNV